METWDLLESPPASAPWNMALDEALLRSAADRGRPLLRLYPWAEPAVSFGYFQKFPRQLAADYTVVRRPTGGGVVYHLADTTYTVIAPPTHPLAGLKTAAAYETLHRAVAAALVSPVEAPSLHTAPLASPSGEYECFQRPVQGDVVLAGRKLAGGAQRRTKWGLLHQGSIATRLTAHQLTDGFSRTLRVTFVPFRLGAADQRLAEQLAAEKYATTAWNQRVT